MVFAFQMIEFMTKVHLFYFFMLSVLGQTWRPRVADERMVLAICQRYGLSELIAKILLNRGIDFEKTEDFLEPKLRHLLPNPFVLKDMEEGIERTLYALSHKQKIVIYGDYDVDGATSTALLRRYFEDIGYPVELYIPDRIEEGYGANAEALLKLRHAGADLVIMTDCGTTAFEPLEAAHSAGLDVIILDHHLSEISMPKACAIVNPNRIDQDDVGLKHLCAAGVTFLFLVALQRKLLHLQDNLPDLMTYLDLVALGTVCDVMTLTGVNRAFVKQGIKILQNGQNLGLKVLSEVAGLSEKASVYHLGFVLGPRINAGGRVGESDLGSRLLTTHNRAEAEEIAKKLHAYNKQRQEMEKTVLEAAHACIQKQGLRETILVGDDSWHPGVIGIVASRLKDFYRRPACVVGFLPNGEGKGSGRSVSGCHLGEAMHQAVRLGLLVKGGGHAMAAGFSVMKQQFHAFHDFLDKTLPLSIDPAVILYDACLDLADATPSLMRSIESLEPFGPGCPAPRFILKKVMVEGLEKIGTDHLRCYVVDESKAKLKVLAFRSIGTPLAHALESKKPMNLYGTLKLDTWGGKQSVYFIPEDIWVFME